MDGEIFYCPSKNEDVFFSKLEAIIAKYPHDMRHCGYVIKP